MGLQEELLFTNDALKVEKYVANLAKNGNIEPREARHDNGKPIER